MFLTGVNRENKLPGPLDNCKWRRKKRKAGGVPAIEKTAAEVEEEGFVASGRPVKVLVTFFYFFAALSGLEREACFWCFLDTQRY